MDLAGFRSALQSAEQPSAYRRWKRINATNHFRLGRSHAVLSWGSADGDIQSDSSGGFSILVSDSASHLPKAGISLVSAAWLARASFLLACKLLLSSFGYAFPRPAAFGIWLCLQGISIFAVLLLSMRLACLTLWPGRWLIVASAVLLADNPISWDLRNHNVNLIYLGLVLAGIANRSSSIGGALLALSFNLKLYSASFFAGLAWWRDYRRLISMLICSLVIASVPILLVGTSGFLTLMMEWVGQVAFTMSEAGDAMAPMSFRRGLPPCSVPM
jgi:Glycosyltransferase family 87